MNEKKIHTLHPHGKDGVTVSKEKYDLIHEKIIIILLEKKEITFNGLMEEITKRLEHSFHGSVSWHVTAVKLDLEARGVLKCDNRRNPHIIKLIKKV